MPRAAQEWHPRYFVGCKLGTVVDAVHLVTLISMSNLSNSIPPQSLILRLRIPIFTYRQLNIYKYIIQSFHRRA